MEYKKIDESHYIIRIDKDEEIINKIKEFIKKENITLASCIGLGAAKYVKIGLFDPIKKEYKSKEYSLPMEITSLIGNVSTKDGEPYLHFHINLCDESMKTIGGHLNECIIGATCEITVTALPGTVERVYDEEIGLNLYKF